jgi:hypothetical protein
MESEKTERGFSIHTFKDKYGVECSLQKSSAARYDAIWLGCNEPNPRALINGEWKNIELPEETVCNTRMHLTQDQVKELLPILTRFAETGEV